MALSPTAPNGLAVNLPNDITDGCDVFLGERHRRWTGETRCEDKAQCEVLCVDGLALVGHKSHYGKKKAQEYE